MQITLSPVRMGETLTLTRVGDSLTINGDTLDLSAIPDGAMLPAEAVSSDWIAGPVTRTDGELCLTLILPVGGNAPEESRFPAPLHLTADGPVELPVYNTPEPEPEAKE